MSAWRILTRITIEVEDVGADAMQSGCQLRFSAENNNGNF